MSTFLERFKTTLEKKYLATQESVDLDTYIQNKKIEITQSPFPHLTADNFFNNEIHSEIKKYFSSVFSRGLVENQDPNYFKPFIYKNSSREYDGYLYTPRHNEDAILKTFFSNTWNLFFSNLFSQPTGICTSLALHYHPPGDKTGFVHHDFAPKWFSALDTAGNNMLYRDRSEPVGINLTKQMRAITLIYYIDLDKNVWKEGDGGETGIYEKKDGEPVKLITPKDNRLFAFQVSPHSFHAFQANQKPRASIIQWFHIDPAWCEKKYKTKS
ncbi:2OG-Fe(II) oxygenase [Patescibacteria group bacterium]|nr:2OG-Fe(II) oxygenase [Patescibacteria group bacterium]